MVEHLDLYKEQSHLKNTFRSLAPAHRHLWKHWEVALQAQLRGMSYSSKWRWGVPALTERRMTLLGCGLVFRTLWRSRPCENVVHVPSTQPPTLARESAVRLPARCSRPPKVHRGQGQPRRSPPPGDLGGRGSSRRTARSRNGKVPGQVAAEQPGASADSARTSGARLTGRWSAAPC